MKQKLTNQQSLAIATREASVALSAGAGCGKTFVLTERFLSYVDPEAVLSQTSEQVADLVAITFTEAAAREMRGRIRAKCLQRMNETQGEAARAWWNLARRLDTARISTIHGFCRSLLAEHAVEAGLDPQFRVLDEAEASLLRLAVVDDLLREKLAKWDDDVFRLATGGRIEALREDLLDLLSQSSSPAYGRWRDAAPEELCEAWRSAAATSVPVAVGRNLAYSAAAARFRAVAEKLRTAPGEVSAKCFEIERLLSELEIGRGSADNFERLKGLAYFRDISKKALWTGERAELKGPCRKALDDLRKKARDTLTLLQFDADAALPAAEDGLALLSLAHQAHAHYRDAKAHRAAVDFDDLIHLAAILLTSPDHAAILQQVRQNTFALLVDEFQDTDRRQLELVQAICGDALAGGKLFFVGDPKQSIYRFRGAQPQVFHELAGRLPEAGRQALTKNFRSQPAILDFVNGLFVHEFFTAEGPDYEPLDPARRQVSPTPAVEFLWTRPTGNSEPQAPNGKPAKLKVEDLRRAEATSIARRLRGLLDSGEPLVWDAEAAAAGAPRARPLRRGDVAILFRALGDVHLYESALRDAGLDYYLVGGHAFYAQQEIHDFVHLLRAVATEADELALAGALRSPIFGLFDETLFWLVREGRKVNPDFGALIAGLDRVEQIAELSEDERAKALRAAATLRHLRDLKDRDTIAALVHAAIERTGYDAVLLGEFLGERKLANLHKLIDHARAADAAGTDLSSFAMQLAHFVAKLPKEALAATSPETADVIRLMTIHQAKGLEFPLVVVPDLNRGAAASRESVALHEDLGPLVRPRPAKASEETPKVGLDFYKALEQDADRAEALRILYVACTRAADYLILSAGLDSENQRAPTAGCSGELMSFVARNFDLDTGRPRRALPDGYAEPQVRVNVFPLDAKARPRGKSVGGNLRRVLEQISRTGYQPALPPEILPVPCDIGPREFSFSRLSGLLHVTEPDADDHRADERTHGAIASPNAARDEALALGQLTHAVLEVLPLGGRADVPSLVARYAEAALSAKDDPYRQQVVARAEQFVARVAASPRLGELASAKQVAREVDFVLRWPPEPPHRPIAFPMQGEGEMDCASLPEEGEQTQMEGVMDGVYVIRGVVDCMYEDREGNWHLVDYKTNRLTGRKLADVAAPYELQLRVYALAMEQILGATPRELVLWFLDSGEEYAVDYNASLRAACVDAVNRAIGQIVGVKSQ